MSNPESHRLLVTAGLSFDLVGAVLLGVEAVKLENIRRLRDAIDERVGNALSLINPQITFVDQAESEPITVAGALGMTCWFAGLLCFGEVVRVLVEL
jgi:hypothetical protein